MSRIRVFVGLLVATVFPQSGLAQQQVVSEPGALIELGVRKSSEERFGSAVAVHGDWMVATNPFADSDSGADPLLTQVGRLWIYRRFGENWVAQQEVTLGVDQFARNGVDVDISDDTIVVALPSNDCPGSGLPAPEPPPDNTDCGAVQFFSRNNDVWESKPGIRSPTGNTNDLFPSAVRVSGNYLIVGAPELKCESDGTGSCPSVFVFEREDQNSEFFNSGIPVVQFGGTPRTAFSVGQAVAVDGNTLAFHDSDGGGPKVSVYINNGDGWQFQQSIRPIPTPSQFGTELGLVGDTLAIGASFAGCPNSGGNFCGQVTVYKRTGSTWALQQTLHATSPTPSARFGTGITLVDGLLAVSSPFKNCSDGPDEECGEVEVFEEVNNAWTSIGIIRHPDESSNRLFGQDIALDSVSRNHLIVGAPTGTSATADGEVLAYERQGNSFALIDLPFQSNLSDLDSIEFGRAVAVSGDYALLAAKRGAGFYRRLANNWVVDFLITFKDITDVDLNNTAAILGSTNPPGVEVYALENAEWVLQQALEDPRFPPTSPSGEENQFGRKVAIQGNTAIVASSEYQCIEPNTTNGSRCGVVFVYKHDGETWALNQTIGSPVLDSSEDEFGADVDLQGNRLVVTQKSGCAGASDCPLDRIGAVYVFERTDESQDFELEDFFSVIQDFEPRGTIGEEVSLSGERLAVSNCDFFCPLGTSVVYLFERIGGEWVEVARVQPDQPVPNQNFGESVLLLGDVLFVGASDRERFFSSQECSAFDTCGRVYVFQLRNSEWTQIAILERPNLDEAGPANFGVSLAGDQSTLMVGAPGNNPGDFKLDFGRVFSYDIDANAPAFQESCFVIPVKGGAVVNFCL